MEQGVPKEPEIQEFLKNVKQVFMVMSGKGGVGKSTMAAGIAASFAAKGLQTGLMDIDVHGPSIARIMGLTGMPLNTMDGKIQPYAHSENLKIISMQGFLQNQDDAVIWRGPLKIGVIKQFMTDVDWGALDVLVIDSPRAPLAQAWRSVSSLASSACTRSAGMFFCISCSRPSPSIRGRSTSASAS